MWKKDIEVVVELHERFHFKGPLLDAGGLEQPCIADYEISLRKSHQLAIELEGQSRRVVVPHAIQNDRYVNCIRPWSFIDPHYLILNPEKGDPGIEELPKRYADVFNTVILVSVLEHVIDPFECSDALFKILRPGGYLFTSAPFMFPIHDARDNWRFSPDALKILHTKSGFQYLEGDFHVNYGAGKGIADPSDPDISIPIMGSYAFCQKPISSI